MTWYIKNPKDATTNLQVISEFGKVAGYKICTKLSVGFLYTNNQKSEREIKETISFTVALKV